MIRLRTVCNSLEMLLLCSCGWYWFGSTGLALAVLWLARSARRNTDGWQDALELDGWQPVWMSSYLLCLRAADGRRLQVFRDEVTASRWAALRRRGFDAQLATGRSTSI